MGLRVHKYKDTFLAFLFTEMTYYYEQYYYYYYYYYYR